jgi:hypothetical protein
MLAGISVFAAIENSHFLDASFSKAAKLPSNLGKKLAVDLTFQKYFPNADASNRHRQTT